MIGFVKKTYRLLLLSLANVIGCATNFVFARRTTITRPSRVPSHRGIITSAADDDDDDDARRSSETEETTSNDEGRRRHDDGESSISEDVTRKLHLRTTRDLDEKRTRDEYTVQQDESQRLKVQRDEKATAIDYLQTRETEQSDSASVSSRNEIERFSEEVMAGGYSVAAGDSKTDRLRSGVGEKMDARKAPDETVDASTQTESTSVRGNFTATTTASQTSVSFSKHYNHPKDTLYGDDIDFGSKDSFETGDDGDGSANVSCTTEDSSDSLLATCYGVDDGTTSCSDHLPVAEIVVELATKFEHEITAKTYRHSINSVLLKIEASGFKSLSFRELAFLHKHVIQHSPKHFERYKTLVEIAARNLPTWKRTTIKEKYDIVHIFATLDAVLKRKNKIMAKQKIDFSETISEREKALEEEIKNRIETEEAMLRLKEQSHRLVELMPEWAIYSQTGNVLDRIESMVFELHRINLQLE